MEWNLVVFIYQAGVFVRAGGSSLWKGLSPAMLRQFLYSGLRYGLYDPLKNFFSFGGKTTSGDASLLSKILAGVILPKHVWAITSCCPSCFTSMLSLFCYLAKGVISGGAAAAIFTPTDLLKLRMQGATVKRYNNLFHAFYTVAKEEKITGLYKGMVPTSQRAAGTYLFIQSTLLAE